MTTNHSALAGAEVISLREHQQAGRQPLSTEKGRARLAALAARLEQQQGVSHVG